MNLSWRLPSHNRPPPHADANPPSDTPLQPSAATLVDESDDPILYNRTYHVHICVTHGYALQNLARHLLHKHTFSPGRRKQIIRAHADEDCTPPERVQTPTEPVDPIEGLAAPVTAYQCRDHECRAIQGHHDNIRKHANRAHSWRKSPDQPTYWNIVQG